jgi:hypothetical protein
MFAQYPYTDEQEFDNIIIPMRNATENLLYITRKNQFVRPSKTVVRDYAEFLNSSLIDLTKLVHDKKMDITQDRIECFSAINRLKNKLQS